MKMMTNDPNWRLLPRYRLFPRELRISRRATLPEWVRADGGKLCAVAALEWRARYDEELCP
jgi:hypothetical protein